MKTLKVFGTMMAVTLISAGVARSEVVFVASTGFDGSGNELANAGVDANYTLTATPGSFTPPGTTGNAYAVTAAGGYPVPPWMANNAASEWISPNFTTNTGLLNAPVGEYDYTTTFTLAGFNSSTFALAGGVATDDNLVNVVLNGFNLGTVGGGAANQSSFTAFNIDQTDAAGDFNAGLNTLTFQVTNGSFGNNNPTGLRIEIDSSTADAAPEPGTFGMFGLGSVLVLASLRRTRKNFNNRG